MKLFGTLLALGGAMSLQVEDLTYDKMRGAFSKVGKFQKKFQKKFSKRIFKNFKNIFRPSIRFMEAKISIQLSLVTTIFHISIGAIQMAMELSHFLNLPVAAQKLDSGTLLKWDGSNGPPTQLQCPWK